MPPRASPLWLSWPLRWVEYFSHPNDLLAFRADYDDLQTDVLTRAEYIRQYRRRILRMQLIVDIRRWRSRLRLNQQDANDAEARLAAESAAAAEARESALMVRHQQALAEAAAAARDRAETTIASSGQTYAERRAARASRNAGASVRAWCFMRREVSSVRHRCEPLCDTERTRGVCSAEGSGLYSGSVAARSARDRTLQQRASERWRWRVALRGGQWSAAAVRRRCRRAVATRPSLRCGRGAGGAGAGV